MIYCNLKGGLGNMLFQIAAVKAFSYKKNIDCSFPNFYNHLSYLNQEIEHNKNLNYAEQYSSFLKLNTKIPSNNIQSYSYPFEYISFVPSEDNFFVDGFFQSEKYFKQFKHQILNEFKSNKKIQNYIKNKYNFLLENKTTISVHIRRGDYVRFNNMHPCQSVEYYDKAIHEIEKKTTFDNIIVFSDDIKWCKDNLKFKNMFFIENEKDYIELFLMCYCNHNIISNSSFSWWGAWMNENKDKIVICPSNWFGHDLSHIQSKDIYPEEWIKI